MPNNPNNNTLLTATEILTVSAGTPRINKGELSATDTVDYYKFTTASASNVNISLTELTGNAKVRFGKLNSSGGFVEEAPPADNSGKLSESIIKPNVAAGTYYIEVTLSGSAPTANYTLSTFASADTSYSSLLWRNEAIQKAATWQMQADGFGDARFLPGDLDANGQPRILDLGPSLYIAGTGDLNGDGADDIVWRDRNDGSVFTWMMDGKTILKKADGNYDADIIKIEGITLAIPNNWLLSGIADMDGDSKADILWRNVNDGTTYIWRMDGTQIASVRQVDANLSVSADWEVAGLADSNNDSRADILWRQKSTGVVGIWLLDAATADGIASVANARKITAPIDTNYQIIAFKDLTGDGKADITWRNASGGKVAFWEIDGADFARTATGGLTVATRELSLVIPSDYVIAGVEDFDGDKKADLLWRNDKNGDVALWLSDLTSASGFKLQKYFAVEINGTEQRVLPDSRYTVNAVKDFNGDGKADIFWRNINEGETGVWTIKSFPISQTSPQDILLDLAQSGFIVAGPSPDDMVKGVLNTKFTRKTQTLTTGDVRTAFNLGVIDGTGNYTESVSGTSKDLYKFKLERTSTLNLDLLNPSNTSQPQSGAVRILKREKADGTFEDVTFTNGDRLLAGVYQIEVSSAGGNAIVPYNLRINGTPIAIDLVGKVFIPPASIELANVPDPNATNKPKSQIDVSYAIENKEPSDAGNVKVRFYISRDEIIDPAADKLLRVVGTTALTDELIVNNVPGNSNPNGSGGTVKLELPDGTDLFWLNDRNYYIGMVIDPVSPALPTGEIEEVGERDVNNLPTNAPSNNYNQAIGKDKQVIAVTNTQVPNLQVLSLNPANTTLTRTSTTSFSYQVRNDGKRSTEGIVSAVELSLYVSDRADLTFENLVTEGARVYLDDIQNSSGQAIPIQGLTSLPVSTGTLDLNSVNPNFWASRPNVTQFYLYAFIDANKQVGESAEDDNVLKAVGVLNITA